MAQSDSTSTPRTVHMKTTILPHLHDDAEPLGWLEENLSLLLTGGGILAVLLIVGLAILIYRDSKTSALHEELRTGIAAFHNGKFDDAISHLAKVSAQLSDSDEAKVAQFYLTEAYLQTGKNDEAKKAAALPSSSSSSTDSTYLSQLVLLADGKTAEKQNDFAAARKIYENAAAIEGPFTLDALWALARVTELADDGTAATVAREKILASYPNAPLAEVVRQKLGK